MDRGRFGTILLSAIGSGVWLKVLSPTLSFLFDIIIRSLSFISVTFKNNIYVEAAKSFHVNASPTLYTFIFIVSAIVIGLILRLIINRLTTTSRTSKVFSTIIVKKSNLVYVHICAIAVMVLSSLYFTSVSSVNKVATQSLNSLDIIAPFIEQKEYLSLKSDFLRIKNVEDYEDFHRKMLELAEKHEIELPLLKPL